MKFYLAGKMTGVPSFNFPLFDAAESKIKELGHDVTSPAEISRRHGVKPDSIVTRELMRLLFAYDLMAVCKSEMIVLLPGWENSEGVKRELYVAEYLGIPSCELSSLIGDTACNELMAEIGRAA
jgi:hypothetical protein